MDSVWSKLASGALKAGTYRTYRPLACGDDAGNVRPLYHYRLPEMASVQRDALLSALSDTLGFPDYFGFNWDAAFDCLTDRDWEAGAVVIIEMNIPPAADADEAMLTTLIEMMSDASRFWIDQNVTLYFLIESPRDDLASLNDLETLGPKL